MNNHRFQKYIIIFFQLLLITAVVGNIIAENWLNLFTSILALVLISLPNYLSKKHYLYMPSFLQFVVILFTFAALYLGELRSYYYRFWWWDNMLHVISGIILGFIGFILVYILNHEENINVVLSPFFIALFSLCFAIAIGVFWEIFEFAMDSILGLNMQKSGLVDTMFDLMVDSTGAFITAIIGFIYIKTKRPSRFQQVVTEFIEKNKEIFFNEDKNNN